MLRSNFVYSTSVCSHAWPAQSGPMRKFYIILTRLRHRSSSLKSDLFDINIIDNRNCSCGAEVENAEHYFYECPLYDVERDRLFRTLPQNYNITFDFIDNGCWMDARRPVPRLWIRSAEVRGERR